MKSRQSTRTPSPSPADLASPNTSAAGAGRASQPRGNAALAEELAAQAQQAEGTELAMGRGHAAGVLAGFGMAAGNALGAGGLPAMLNPNGYWDTMPERQRTELIQPGGAARLKPAN